MEITKEMAGLDEWLAQEGLDPPVREELEGLKARYMAAAGFMQGSSVATFILMCCETFPGRTASASSLATLASSVATLTAPLWMGAMAESTGFRIPLLLVCAMLVLSVILVVWVGRREEA